MPPVKATEESAGQAVRRRHFQPRSANLGQQLCHQQHDGSGRSRGEGYFAAQGGKGGNGGGLCSGVNSWL